MNIWGRVYVNKEGTCHHEIALECGTHVIRIRCHRVAAWGQGMCEKPCVHTAMRWYWNMAHVGQVFPRRHIVTLGQDMCGSRHGHNTT